MIQLEISIDASGTIADLDRIEKGWDGAVESALHQVAIVAMTNARSSNAFKDRTGDLRRSIRILEPGRYERQIIADTPYAGYVELGNGPPGGRIYPKNGAKAIPLRINGGFDLIFRKWVRTHQGKPFFLPAANLAESMADDIFSYEISKLIRNAS